MWEGESSGPLHALHFGNSLGSVVAPLIIRPFLSPDVNSSLPKHEIGLPGNILGNNSSTVASSRIQIPFGAYGLYTLFWGGLFLWFYVNDRQTPAREGLFYTANDRQNSEIFGKQGTFAGVQKSFGIFMAVVLCLMYICLSGVYQSLSTYLMPMSVQGPLHMSKADGNLLLFGYSFSMVVGRLLAVFLSKFFSSQWLLPFEIGLTLGGAIGLYFYSFRSVMFIWVLTCAFSFTSAPIFPAGIAWSEIYLEITGPLMAVFFAGGGFGTLIFQWLSGYGIQNHGVFFPIYVNLGATVATAVLFLVACIRCWTFGPRQVGDKQTLDESNRHVQQSKADEQSPLIT
ncbi:sodium-dependent glucose transporter 1-like [Liolophura sinensis]|uniref:sodium-dependent glucose transporter 1-like n=1 Tax=Liolophura sinensis TaxID=3198878 RepID=UPI003158E649